MLMPPDMLFVLLIHTTALSGVSAQINLTPFGTATQSSLIDPYFGGPENAIRPPISNIYSEKFCTYTPQRRTHGWWMFQFSFGEAFITEVTIYYGDMFPYGMDGFKLFVTNTSTIPPVDNLCYADSDPGLPNITITIPCHQTGQYVIYFNDYQSKFGVELCYIEIIGCQKGNWGRKCENMCSENCIGRHCYPGNGSCVEGCKTENCLNDICSKLTGVCIDGCKKRRTGVLCNEFSLHTTESDEAPIRIGIFSGGVILGVLITTVVCVLILKTRHFRKKQSKDNTTKKTKSNDQQQYDTVKMENVSTMSTYQDLSKNPMSNEYDQINTAYVNH